MGVASSLREIAEGVTARLVIDAPEIRIEPIFGASSTHARQLQLGAPFDVLVSADADLMEALTEGGWIERASVREIARGKLILLGRASLRIPAFEALNTVSTSGTSASTSGLQDQRTHFAAIFLSKDVKRVAVPSEVVPLGRYARAWLRAQDLLEPLEGKLVTTEHARASLSAVEAGHVDLAFGYASDRRLLRDAQFLSELDARHSPPIRYVAARTKHAARCVSAQTVLAAWSQPTTRRALAEGGFSPAKDETSSALRRIGDASATRSDRITAPSSTGLNEGAGRP